MKNQQPEKIDVEKNPLGINFLKSKKVKKYFDENTFLWSRETTPGPVIGNKATPVSYTHLTLPTKRIV